jgi:hypothetical protein
LISCGATANNRPRPAVRSGFRQAAASRTALIALHDHIAAVLAIADAVIDLDQTAR